MPGKKKSAKKRGSSRSPSRSPSGSAKKKGKKSAKSARGSAKSRPSTAVEQRDPDMMHPVAMENLYYICHGAADALEIRGFGWAEAPKKKGKKGKKKK